MSRDQNKNVGKPDLWAKFTDNSQVKYKRLKYVEKIKLIFCNSKNMCEIATSQPTLYSEFSLIVFDVGSGTRHFLYYNNLHLLIKL